MERVFEDLFMDAQVNMISLCLEMAGNKPVDTIYFYASLEDDSLSSNVFYQQGDQVLGLMEMTGSTNLIRQFFSLSMQDLTALIELCKENDRPVPTELKLVFQTAGKRFSADYRYDPVCTPATGVTPMQVFTSWKEAVKEEIKKGN